MDIQATNRPGAYSVGSGTDRQLLKKIRAVRARWNALKATFPALAAFANEACPTLSPAIGGAATSRKRQPCSAPL